MRYKAFMSYSRAVDGKLAPRVQSALHRLAKPPLKPRALHVFRDQTNLSASPGLWSSIEEALDQSEYFILMASPAAAASQWVRREVEHWLTRSPMARAGKAAAHFLIILTEGEILWDQQAGEFDWERTDAIPLLLRGAFQEEPLYVDLRGARTEEDLSLRNPEFSGRIAELAATLHGRSKEELIGEDIRIARRSRRMRRMAVSGLAVLTIAALAFAGLFYVQRNTALSRELAARAVASLEIDPASSLQHALRAAEIAHTPEAEAALREALIRSSLLAVLSLPAATIVAAGFSPDGEYILTEAVSSEDSIEPGAQDAPRTLHVWNGRTGVYQCAIANASAARFSADGARILTGERRIYETASCRTPYGDAPGDRRWSFGGAIAAPEIRQEYWPYDQYPPGEGFRDSAEELELVDGVIREVASGEEVRTIETHEVPLRGAVFGGRNGSSDLLITWTQRKFVQEVGLFDGESAARLWDVRSPANDRALIGHRRTITSIAFTPSAEFVITGSDDRTARLWSTSTGVEYIALRGHLGAVQQVVVSSDGTRVLTVGDDGTARLWEPAIAPPQKLSVAELFALRYGVSLPELQGDEPPARVPELSRDRHSIVGTANWGDVVVWDAATGARKGVLQHAYGPARGALSPDGLRVVTTEGDPESALAHWEPGERGAQVWDVATREAIRSFPEVRGHAFTAAYSPDGRLLVTAGQDGVARFWDAASFSLIDSLRVSDSQVLHAAFDSSGGRLVTGSRDSFAWIWNLRTGQPPLELFGHDGAVVHASFSPDDALVLTVASDGVRVWDATTGKLLRRYAGGESPELAFITPDCGRLVVQSGDEARVHPFAACGTLDQLLSIARTRVDRAPRQLRGSSPPG